MLAMQYGFTLPTDYDMGIIERRIADKGSALNGFHQLQAKAFLYARKGEAGSLENRYAPFYLWHDNEGMNRFLEGPGFAALVQSFGWPTVDLWSVWSVQLRDNFSTATWASVQHQCIAPYSDLGSMRTQEEARLEQQWQGESACLGMAGGFSAQQWQLLRYCLWAEQPAFTPSPGLQLYRVGYVAR